MKKTEIGRESVLSALKSRAPRAMHLMEVVGALNLPKTRRDDIRDLLDELTGLGMATEMPGSRYRVSKARPKKAASSGPTPAPGASASPAAAASEKDEIFGWLSIHPRGFAFVASEDGGEDVFVPPTGRLNALHGDRVRVRARPSSRGREGEVVEVVRRGVKRVSGTYESMRKEAWLKTSDPRLPERIDVVGTVPLGIEPGAEVVAVIESWPDFEGDRMEARVLSALGPRGSAEVEIEKIKIREGIEEEFEDDVLREAQAFGTRLDPEELAQREDLRHLDLLTIDPPTARDHDDAVWAERLPDGAIRVVVAIADVSYYVRAGSALDRAALERATSIYLPDRVIPMLPHELSSNLASLVPDEDRLTMAVDAEVDVDGRIRSHRFVEGVMRSRARLSYGGVARTLGFSEDAEHQPAADTWIGLLEVLWEASQRLRKRRQKRGSLDFDLPEAEIVLGEDREPMDIRRSRNDPGLKKAYGMIEDLMLLANEVVAEDLHGRNMPCIYRVHGRPDERKIEVFAQLAEALGYPLDSDAAAHPKKLAEFLRGITDPNHAKVLSGLLLRAMQQASYGTENIGHFALAATHYLHFTSPIRRYPDLAVHRVVRDIIRKNQVEKRDLAVTLRAQAATSSRLERRAMLIDRETTSLYRALLMKDRVGETFQATISGVAEHGLYVTFDEPFVEARCPIDTLGDDWFEPDALGLRLVGRRSGFAFSVSDRIEVRLVNVSIEQRELTVNLERTEGQPEARPPRSSRPTGKRSPNRNARGGRSSDRGAGAKTKGGGGPRKKGAAGASAKGSARNGATKKRGLGKKSR